MYSLEFDCSIFDSNKLKNSLNISGSNMINVVAVIENVQRFDHLQVVRFQ